MRDLLLAPFGLLLVRREQLLADLLAGRNLWRHWRSLLLVLCLGSAAYGAVLGSWHDSRLALYVAVKLPLLLLLTSAATMLLHWILAALLGVPLRFGQVANLAFLTLAIASVLLGSLAPVAALFTASAPDPTTQARGTHNLLYLLHTGLVGGCGLYGSASLWAVLQRLPRPRAELRRVYLCWVLSFALIGGEVAWALRPFVGSIYHPVVFLRPDALDGNVYEFVWTDILPYLLGPT